MIEVLVDLPSNWSVKHLSDVANIYMGQSPPSSSYNENGKGVAFLQGKAEFGEIFPRNTKWTTQPKRISASWSILISVRAPVGNVNISDRRYAIGRGLAEVRPKQHTDAWYLFFVLLYERPRLRSEASGTIFQSINKKTLQEFLILHPPLPEQRAIAHVLRTVQEASEATARVIVALRDFKRALMRHLFTYGPVPVDMADQVALQDTPIGPIPAHWRVVRLGDVVTLRKGTIHPSDAPNARYIGLEHLTPGEIRIKQFGRAGSTRSAKSVFEEGDVLYGKLRPYLDKAAIAEWPGVCSTDILVLQPVKAEPLFLAYLMHTPFVLNHAIATTAGVNHPRTSWKALSQAFIPLPPLPEQRAIARILQTVDRKIEAEEARQQALDDLFRSLLHHLMTAKVRLPQGVVQRFEEVNSREQVSI